SSHWARRCSGGRLSEGEGRRVRKTGFRIFFLLPSTSDRHPLFQGSSRFTGERGSDFEEEVVGVAVAVGHALDDLDAVVDAFEDAGIEAVTGAGDDAVSVLFQPARKGDHRRDAA